MSAPSTKPIEGKHTAAASAGTGAAESKAPAAGEVLDLTSATTSDSPPLKRPRFGESQSEGSSTSRSHELLLQSGMFNPGTQFAQNRSQQPVRNHTINNTQPGGSSIHQPVPNVTVNSAQSSAQQQGTNPGVNNAQRSTPQLVTNPAFDNTQQAQCSNRQQVSNRNINNFQFGQSSSEQQVTNPLINTTQFARNNTIPPTSFAQAAGSSTQLQLANPLTDETQFARNSTQDQSTTSGKFTDFIVNQDPDAVPAGFNSKSDSQNETDSDDIDVFCPDLDVLYSRNLMWWNDYSEDGDDSESEWEEGEVVPLIFLKDRYDNRGKSNIFEAKCQLVLDGMRTPAGKAGRRCESRVIGELHLVIVPPECCCVRQWAFPEPDDSDSEEEQLRPPSAAKRQVLELLDEVIPEDDEGDVYRGIMGLDHDSGYIEGFKYQRSPESMRSHFSDPVVLKKLGISKKEGDERYKKWKKAFDADPHDMNAEPNPEEISDWRGPTPIIFIHKLHLEEEFRGRYCGSYFLTKVLSEIGWQCRVVVAPHPLKWEHVIPQVGDPMFVDEDAVEAAEKKAAAMSTEEKEEMARDQAEIDRFFENMNFRRFGETKFMGRNQVYEQPEFRLKDTELDYDDFEWKKLEY